MSDIQNLTVTIKIIGSKRRVKVAVIYSHPTVDVQDVSHFVIVSRNVLAHARFANMVFFPDNIRS